MHFKNSYRQEGVQFSYEIILGGYGFDTPHFSENLRAPPPPGRNKRSVPNKLINDDPPEVTIPDPLKLLKIKTTVTQAMRNSVLIYLATLLFEINAS